MDPTDSNPEANAKSSSEETSSFEQYAFSRELFESDSFSLSEEGERDSAYPEYKSFIRPRILEDDHFIAVRYPLPGGSISYSSESESESSPIMVGAPPTRDEFDRLTDQVTALTIAIGALTPRASSSVIADPNNFQRSPYAQPAPLDLNSKSGLHLYTEAQEALKVPFNGKAANVQPFLNPLAVDVKKFCLDTAVTVTNAAGPVNLLWESKL